MILSESSVAIEREGELALNSDIVIRPELSIGTELWFMRDNKPRLALVAGYNVYVTGYNPNDKANGWYHQMFFRWLNRKQKQYWRYSFEYSVKIDADITSGNRLDKQKDGWYLYDRKCFFSKEELLKNL